MERKMKKIEMDKVTEHVIPNDRTLKHLQESDRAIKVWQSPRKPNEPVRKGGRS